MFLHNNMPNTRGLVPIVSSNWHIYVVTLWTNRILMVFGIGI